MATKKKIVIDARESGTSTGRYVDKLIEYLHELNPSYKIVIMTRRKRVEFMEGIAPKFEIVTTRFKEFTFGEQTGLLLQLRRLKADLVHFSMVQQPVLYMGKVVTTMNDLTTTRFRNPSKNWLVFTVKQQAYKLVNKIVARKSATILTYTEYVKDDVAKYTHTNSRKITVTPLAADKIREAAEPVEGLQDTRFIMYVGRPLPHKNLPRLVQAFQQLKETHPELKLVLAGKKDRLYAQIANTAKSRGAGEDIVFTGFVTEAQLRWLYENTAAYVFPSLSEGFGLPGLEAMAHGAPVVSSNASCLPEVYGDAAQYFDPLDVEDMAAQIGRVLSSEKLSEKLRLAGREQAKQYSWARMARQTLDIYNEALDL